MAGANNGGDQYDHDGHDDYHDDAEDNDDASWLVLSFSSKLFKWEINSWAQCRCPLLCTNEKEKEYTSVHIRIDDCPHPHHHISSFLI